MSTDANPYQAPADSKEIKSTPDENMWAMLSHLAPIAGFGVIGPLIIWLTKKDSSSFIDDQAKEALNFQLSAAIFVLLLIFTLVGILLAPVVGVGSAIFAIMGAMEANKGVAYRYPYTFRMIK